MEPLENIGGESLATPKSDEIDKLMVGMGYPLWKSVITFGASLGVMLELMLMQDVL